MLQRRPTDFAHRNLLLQVLLGLESLSAQFEVMLERHVPAEAKEQATEEDRDELTLALLGAVAIQRRLAHHLAQLDAPEPPPEPPEGTPPKGILR